MRTKRKNKAGEKSVAFFEVITIILSTIAFTYIIAMSIPSVSAANVQCVSDISNNLWQVSSDGRTVQRLSGGISESVSQFCLTSLGACGTNNNLLFKFDCPGQQQSSSSTPVCVSVQTDAFHPATVVQVPSGETAFSYCVQGQYYSCNQISSCSGSSSQTRSSSSGASSLGSAAIPVAQQVATGVATKAASDKIAQVLHTGTGNAGAGIGSGAGTGAAGGATTSGATNAGIGDINAQAAAAAKAHLPTQAQIDSLTNSINTPAGLSAKQAAVRIIGAWAAAAIMDLGIKLGLKAIGVGSVQAGTFATNAAVGYGAFATVGAVISATFHVGGIFSSTVFLGLSTLGLIGLGVGILISLFTFKNTKYISYSYNCYPWSPPTGGADCNQCNVGNFPCTQYRCESLGQGCTFINQGDRSICYWNNSKDVNPPVMTPWADILPIGYKYTPDNSVSPPDNGVKIVPINNNNGCINATDSVAFGVTVDKPSKCKYDVLVKKSFNDMQNYLGDSITTYNHSITIPLLDPNAAAAENISLPGNGQFSFFVKCQSANGIPDTANYEFKFCVNKQPDNTAPLIKTTTITNNSYILFNTSSVNLLVGVKDQYPINCKWSKTDQDYSTMENSMSCPSSIVQVGADSLYMCNTTLTGLISSSQNNQFYFRCQDTSPQNNTNSQSYLYVLKGSQPLAITSIGPNGTIMNSTNVIKATLSAATFGGASQGGAQCAFSDSGNAGTYDTFLSDANTFTNYQHSQDLYLVPGNYQYYIQCIDLGGNKATNSTAFTVQSDTSPPIVVRAYHDVNNLKIVTDENSKCVYNTDNNIGCTYQFSDGRPMTNVQSNVNQVSWDPTKTFYIKCMDDFGNQPAPNECSIIASPYSVSSQ